MSPMPLTSKPSLTTRTQRPERFSSSLTLSASASSVSPASGMYICRGVSRSGSARRAAAGMKPMRRPMACKTSTGSAGHEPRFSSSAFATRFIQ